MPGAILGLDQGTTGNTALVFSHDGEILGRAYQEIHQHYPQPGWVEHDAEEIFESVLHVVAQALDEAGLAAGDLKAIGITNQRETTVVWDQATGEPIHRAIVWQSRQTAEICEQLRADGHEPMIRDKTGLVTDAYFSGTKVRWILDEYPQIRERAERGDILFGTIDTWLLWRLTGGPAGGVHKTEPTNASRTLLFNIHQKAWDQEILELLDIPAAMLPTVTASSSEIFGKTAELGALPAGVPISGIAGDQQAALYGQGCWQAGQAKNTYGTGCFLLMNTGQARPQSEGGLLTTLGCDERGRPVYCLEGSVFTGGAAIQWLRDGLQLIRSADETEEMARRAGSNLGVYLVPAFSGLGAPYWDMQARGTIIGLTRGATRDHLARAALESIAYQSRDVLDLMNRESGLPIAELRVDGGAAANDFLMQFQADLTGVPVDRPAQVETTAMGAAFLAGLAVDFWQEPQDVAHARKRERLFEPEMGQDERDGLYRGWQRAVERSLGRP